jgi:hypothetical protein
MAILTDAMGNQIGYEDDAPVDQPLAQPSENSPLNSAINKVKNVATNYNPLMVMKSLQDLARTAVVNPAIGALGAAQGLVRSVPDLANDISNYAKTGQVGTTGLDTATDLTNRFNQMHMQPAQTPLGQNFEDYLAKKAPDIPIFPMSPKGGIIGNMTGLEERRPLVSPSDVRAAIGKAQIVGGELRDLPQDFRNAQSGIQRQNILGEPTLGVKAQGVADSIGDIMAKRQMQGLPPVPGIPAELQPRTNMYAVRPEGSHVISATTQKIALEQGGMDDVIRDILPYGPVLDQDSANALYRHHVIGDDLHEAFENFTRQKAQEEFPNLDASDAQRAVHYKYPGQEHDDYMKNVMNEFAAANGLISVDQLAENHKKGVAALNGPFKQYISKYLGTEKDPLLNEALKGITMRASDDLASMPPSNEDIEHARTKFNPNMPLGTVTPKIAKKQEEIVNLQKESDDRQETRDKLHQQAVSEGYDRPMTYPGAKENIKALEKVNTALQRAHTDMDNLNIAHDYENMADDALLSKTAEKMWQNIPPPERQFYPQLEHIVNTNPQETVYDVRSGALHRLGVKQIGDEIYNRLLTGKMTEKELARTPIDALVRDVTKERIAKELEVKKSLVGRKEKISSIYRKDLATIPPQNHFGNAHIKEIDDNMSPEEIEFWLSGETEVLDHCVAKGLDRPPHKHAFTGAARAYLPLTDISAQSAEYPWGKRFSETTRKNLTSFIYSAMKGDTKFASLRDSKTGMPVGLVELSDMRQDAAGNKTYQVGYATQYNNKDIDPKYRNSLRDYLNTKSDEIRNMNTTEKSGIYDTKALSARFLANKANMSEAAFKIASETHGLPRFATQEDLMDLKHHNPPPANVVAVRRQHGNNDRLNDLEAVQAQLTDEMRDIGPNDFPSQAEFDTAYADLQSMLGDATQRHTNLTRRLEQDYPHLTNNARYLIGSGNPLIPIPSITRSGSNARVKAAYRAYLEDMETWGLPQEEFAQFLLSAEHELEPGNVDPQEFGLNTDEEMSDLGRMLTEHGDAVNYYDQRGNNIEGQVPAQQAAQPDREPTEMQRVIAGMQNTPTPRLREAMWAQQVLEVDSLANELFGNYEHHEVADMIHSLRNGDAAPGDNLYRDFSAQQRELLARELERRLPAPANGENLNIGDFEPDDQHGANQPGLGVNPAYQIETARTSLPRPVIDFLDSFFRINNIDSHPANILEEAYHDLLEHITRHERGTLWELTPRQREEALIHVDTVMQNMGLNVDFDIDEPQAQLPAPAAPPAAAPPAEQQLNRAITNAYTESLQYATTPDSHRLMQAIIGHVNDITNNMFGIGYSPEQIAHAALERFNSYRNEIAGSTPLVLGVDRHSYNNFLELLRYAIDDLSAVYGRIDPAQQQQQVANADPIARHIQMAALTDLQASLRTNELNEVRELADEAAHPNNANTPTDLRALAQTVRQYSAGQPWEDFNHAQRELLALQLEQHATDIEAQQRPPGHKKGGYITRKPSIDEMRFALMKGK